MAIRVLFSEAIGFKCIEAGMSNPMIGRFSSLADDYLKNTLIGGLYCYSEYLGRKVKYVKNYDWSQIDLASVVGETKYPQPKA
mgnify:CR=1 FL=1